MKTLYQAAVIVCTLAGMASCRSGEKADNNSNAGFTLSDSLYKTLNIYTAQSVETENLLQLNGKVTFNDDKVIRVYPLISGTVESVKVQLGDIVHKGQVLAVMQSTELAGFSNDLVNARTSLSDAKKNLDATEDLYKSGIESAKDLLAAQNAYAKAQSELQRVERVLQVNGTNGNTSQFEVKAPCDGFIVEKFVTDNMKIRPDNGNNLFTISDLKKVWIIANAYESDIAKVKMGDKANITTLTYPDKTFPGTVDKIFNALDPVNKVMKVRMQLDNPGYLLKPEMYTNIMLASSVSRVKLPAVPSKAIIFDNSRNYVLVIKDKSNIQIREVRTGQTIDGSTVIVSGVADGEKVITNNQLYIYQALNINGR
ncbi:efflux RND transporter periplasmic adaptor subunit [Chitinophaga vietnamensis]|uniref:efflux RND transporter periplasmic adaptor subunit n=1 Tax=Chitinophaga vietnamensis TaxID=2593957 RepID=UPI0011784AEE|nr:efflux RND transporter periplasmic adaptor subunit [Chitinophaga vietnamensis]